MVDLTKGVTISRPPAPPPGPGGAGGVAAACTSSPPDFALDLARLVSLLGASVAARADVGADADADADITAPTVETGDPVDALWAEVALAQPGVIPLEADPEAPPSTKGRARTLQVALTPPGAAVAADHRAAPAAEGHGAAPALPLLPAAAAGSAAFTVLLPTQETPVEVSNPDGPDTTTIAPLNVTLPAEAAPRAAAVIAATPVDILQPQGSRQIAETVTWHVPAQGAAEVRIRLNPEELGPLDVQLRVDGDKVSVRFDLGDERVRDVVQASLPSLSSMLAARGLQLDQAQVFAQARGQGSPQHPETSQAPWSSVAREGDDAELSVTSATRPLIRRGLLDDYA